MATIIIRCPFCERSLKMRQDHGGRRGRCPGCGGIVEIPPSDGLTTLPPRPAPPPVPEKVKISRFRCHKSISPPDVPSAPSGRQQRRVGFGAVNWPA
jgi:hypothetical protein